MSDKEYVLNITCSERSADGRVCTLGKERQLVGAKEFNTIAAHMIGFTKMHAPDALAKMKEILRPYVEGAPIVNNEYGIALHFDILPKMTLGDRGILARITQFTRID